MVGFAPPGGRCKSVASFVSGRVAHLLVSQCRGDGCHNQTAMTIRLKDCLILPRMLSNTVDSRPRRMPARVRKTRGDLAVAYDYFDVVVTVVGTIQSLSSPWLRLALRASDAGRHRFEMKALPMRCVTTR